MAEARRHFLAHGFRNITTADLAHELGISKKTLYAHFPSKIALVEEAILDKFNAIEAELERVSDSLDALPQLLACLQRHADEIQPAFVRDVRREAPELFAIIERRRAALIERYFGRVFREGQRSGVIRKDMSARLITETLLGAVQAVMNPAKMEQLDLTPKTGLTAIVSLVLHGAMAATAKARRA